MGWRRGEQPEKERRFAIGRWLTVISFYPSLLSWLIVDFYLGLEFFSRGSVGRIPGTWNSVALVVVMAGQIVSLIWGLLGIGFHAHEKSAWLAVFLSLSFIVMLACMMV